MTCTHQTYVSEYRIVSHDIDGEPEYDYDSNLVDTVQDVDLHRYKCTQCGEMFYYSSRARDFFERGIESETYGLTLFNLIKFGGIIPKDYRSK